MTSSNKPFRDYVIKHVVNLKFHFWKDKKKSLFSKRKKQTQKFSSKLSVQRMRILFQRSVQCAASSDASFHILFTWAGQGEAAVVGELHQYQVSIYHIVVKSESPCDSKNELEWKVEWTGKSSTFLSLWKLTLDLRCLHLHSLQRKEDFGEESFTASFLWAHRAHMTPSQLPTSGIQPVAEIRHVQPAIWCFEDVFWQNLQLLHII